MCLELLYLSLLWSYGYFNFLRGQLLGEARGCSQGDNGGRVGDVGVPVDTLILGGNDGNIWYSCSQLQLGSCKTIETFISKMCLKFETTK